MSLENQWIKCWTSGKTNKKTPRKKNLTSCTIYDDSGLPYCETARNVPVEFILNDDGTVDKENWLQGFRFPQKCFWVRQICNRYSTQFYLKLRKIMSVSWFKASLENIKFRLNY